MPLFLRLVLLILAELAGELGWRGRALNIRSLQDRKVLLIVASRVIVVFCAIYTALWLL